MSTQYKLQSDIPPEPGSHSKRSGMVTSSTILSEDSYADPSHPDSIAAQEYVQRKLVSRRNDDREDEAKKMSLAIHDFMEPHEVQTLVKRSKDRAKEKRKREVYAFKVKGEGDNEIIQQSPEAGKRVKLCVANGQSVTVKIPVVRSGEQKILEALLNSDEVMRN